MVHEPDGTITDLQIIPNDRYTSEWCRYYDHVITGKPMMIDGFACEWVDFDTYGGEVMGRYGEWFGVYVFKKIR